MICQSALLKVKTIGDVAETYNSLTQPQISACNHHLVRPKGQPMQMLRSTKYLSHKHEDKEEAT